MRNLFVKKVESHKSFVKLILKGKTKKEFNSCPLSETKRKFFFFNCKKTVKSK